MTIQQYPTPASGIPTGATANRPSSPSVGDVFYNGTLVQLEIWTGSAWEPCSSLPSRPTISVVDVGTNAAYGAAQATATFTPASTGGVEEGYIISSTTGGYFASSTGTAVTVTVGNNGSYSFSGEAYNNFGISIPSLVSTLTLTTVPQAPTIGTATTSSGTTNVSVTWTLNANGGKNLTSITITPYLNGTTAQTSQTAATTSSVSHTFTGLTGGSAYTFKVKASNANGDSAESNATSSITVPDIVATDFLVIAGGGGGGKGIISNQPQRVAGGGGGAGGYRTSAGTSGRGANAESGFNVTASENFTVTVGAGGAGGSNNAVAVQGSSSVLSNITSTGGGLGGAGGAVAGGSGGAGGGGSASSANGQTSNGGAGTTGQGYDGAGSVGGANNGLTGGGGGGAGGAGGTAPSNTSGGNGGNGVDSNITGNTVTRGGGGGGAGNNGGSNGGNGGGGGGNANETVGTAGTANTGGGGGGGGSNSNSGGAGGSGIVVLRYPSNRSLTIGAGLTSNTNTSGNNKITTFNAGTGTVSIA